MPSNRSASRAAARAARRAPGGGQSIPDAIERRSRDAPDNGKGVGAIAEANGSAGGGVSEASTYNFTSTAGGLRQAQNTLGKLEEAKILAGGQSLIPTMKLRLASPANIVDLSKIEGLGGIELKGRSLVIGAMARHAEVAASDAVKSSIPALAALAHVIGDPAVRHQGTLGGSVANNDPNADYPAACLGLGATIVTTKRRIASDDFFKGLFETALEPDEIITKVMFPIPKKAGYMKFRNQASRFALVGVFVVEAGQARNPRRRHRRGLERRVPRHGVRGSAEEAFAASRWRADRAGTRMNADIHGSAEYARALVASWRGARWRRRTRRDGDDGADGAGSDHSAQHTGLAGRPQRH